MLQLPSHTRITTLIRRRLACSISAAIFASQLGCVALNIPSERHFDPRDGGGLMGDWKKPAYPGRVLQRWVSGSPDMGTHELGREAHVSSDVVYSDSGITPHASGSGAVESCFGDDLSNDFADPMGQVAPVQAPEVPWPRYHSVPTRPVFGGTRQAW